MLQVVYVVASAGENASYNPINPVALVTLPTTGGDPLLESGPITLAEDPLGSSALGPKLISVNADQSVSIRPPLYVNDGTVAPAFPDALAVAAIVFMFPLGPKDWLIATRQQVGRVTDGALVWMHPIMSAASGYNCIPCALVKQGEDYYIIVRTNPDDFWSAGAAHYKQIDITGANSPGIFTAWPSIAMTPDEMGYGLFGYEAIPFIFPAFEHAMIAEVSPSADGLSLLRKL